MLCSSSGSALITWDVPRLPCEDGVALLGFTSVEVVGVGGGGGGTEYFDCGRKHSTGIQILL